MFELGFLREKLATGVACGFELLVPVNTLGLHVVVSVKTGNLAIRKILALIVVAVLNAFGKLF